MSYKSLLLVGIGAWALGDFSAQAQPQNPLSAIDWLSQSLANPKSDAEMAAIMPPPQMNSTSQGAKKQTPPWGEPPVASGGALPQDVATSSLDGPKADAIGLISPDVSGLPQNLWGAGRSTEIATAIVNDKMDSLPALRQLMLTLLLAEANAPVDSGPKATLLLARIDKLLQIGAVEQAAALLQISGTPTPDLFRRAFDTALLTGHETRACQIMKDAPGLAPTLPARVFCLARLGQWDAAALTLSTSSALHQLDSQQVNLLERFLDSELSESEIMAPPPNPVTPLDWKIYEAVGETLPTTYLPTAFAYADLSQTAGWKAQIEAAERLTRAGTIAPNVILSLYTQRSPAASGGVWDRVQAFQDFDNALSSGQLDNISQQLEDVWLQMQLAELEVAFAMLYGKALYELGQTHPLSDKAQSLAFQIGLLSPAARDIAQNTQARDQREQFLAALALGRNPDVAAPDRLARSFLPAFVTAPDQAPISKDGRELIEGQRPGEAVLLALQEIRLGLEGNTQSLIQGFGLLRVLGLDSVARRAALEMMLLERRG